MDAEVSDGPEPGAGAIPKLLGAAAVVGIAAGVGAVAFLTAEHALQKLLWQQAPDLIGGRRAGGCSSSCWSVPRVSGQP